MFKAMLECVGARTETASAEKVQSNKAALDHDSGDVQQANAIVEAVSSPLSQRLLRSWKRVLSSSGHQWHKPTGDP